VNLEDRIIGAFIQVSLKTGNVSLVQVMANSSEETNLICRALLEIFNKSAAKRLIEPIFSHNNGKKTNSAPKKILRREVHNQQVLKKLTSLNWT
jgi:hypothetical protein